MKTVLSKTGIEVLYPCTVHLLRNGEILECEYKSNHIGQDLLAYICEYQDLDDTEYWGLKYVDTFEQRHWLELDKLIRSQVKNMCPIHFHFRVKVYPPEPYRLVDTATKHQIFLQLRYDLVSGRLCCGPNDSALLVALTLQYIYGNFNPNTHIGNYVKERIIMNQNFIVETKAVEIHKNNLKGLSRMQVEDLFLRMACQLEAYGIDPYLVEVHNQSNLNLWVNHNGMVTYVDNEKVHHLRWMDISKVEQDDEKLIVKMGNDEVMEFVCLTRAECDYIYRSVVDHLVYFTSLDNKSTLSLVGTDDLDEETESETRIIDNGAVEKETDLKNDARSVINTLTESETVKTSLGNNIVTQSQYYLVCIVFVLIIVGILSNWDVLYESNYFGLHLINSAVSFLTKPVQYFT